MNIRNKEKHLDDGVLEEVDKALLKELIDFIQEKSISPFRFFIVLPKEYYLVFHGNITHGFHREDFGVVRIDRIERGLILDAFTKVELLVDEIFRANILNNYLDDSTYIDSLLRKIDLSSKIHILYKEWNLIRDDTFQMFLRLKDVRNIVAHSWHFENAIYGKGQTLKTNFIGFNEDMKEMWKRLVSVYHKLAPQSKIINEALEIIKKLKR